MIESLPCPVYIYRPSLGLVSPGVLAGSPADVFRPPRSSSRFFFFSTGAGVISFPGSRALGAWFLPGPKLQFLRLVPVGTLFLKALPLFFFFDV